LKINIINKFKNKATIVSVIFLIIAALYFFIDPAKNSFFPKCPLKTITGYECAGCGVQRAFHELLHLRFLEAFKYNPLFLIFGFLFLIVLVINLFKKSVIQMKLNSFITGKTFVFLLLILVFVFSLLKNTEFYKDFISGL